MSYTFVEGDTGVKLVASCAEGDPAIAINLTGHTVMLRWKSVNGIIEKAMVITDAAAGQVEYAFVTADLVPPEMEFEIIITDAGGHMRTSLTAISYRIRERLY